MKTTYEVKIKLFNETEYKGIMTEEHNKIYIRSYIDLDDYETMFKSLYEDGYVKVDETDKVEMRKFNSLKEILQYLKNDFDITYQVIDDNFLFSLVAEGKDLHPETIAINKEGMKLISLAQNFYNCANNINYEPKVKNFASSFGVGIQEIEGNNEKLIEIISDINNNKFLDINRFFNDKIYNKLVRALLDVLSVKTLDKLTLNINNKPYTLQLNSIKQLKQDYERALQSKIVDIKIEPKNSLRAFDDKKLKADLDYSLFSKNWFRLHFDSKELFEKLQNNYKNNLTTNIKGNLISSQTIQVTKVY